MDRAPNVILEGGPTPLPDEERVRYVADPGQKIKLYRGHRYDHFEPTAQTSPHHGRELLVFQWSGSTFVAE
ncbi:DUF5988 family protein [Streptomyces litchfieldiae]|uniref:DUF5988 family protein n=1 Tax=Streptomyces litchfieldiae TaxID=3075543 RepID=A0ABU2N0A1_9ACTN|nr:DUF5988 family protein [Streptomyces sp. DSM 44938]MDT0347328.1 DUF5988 family protein [Streptomyces sp. DSM 44938]